MEISQKITNNKIGVWRNRKLMSSVNNKNFLLVEDKQNKKLKNFLLKSKLEVFRIVSYE